MRDKLINAKVIYPTLGHTVLSTGQDKYRDENVEVVVHVGINASGHAWFEFGDTKWHGEKYYATGSLDIEDGRLVDYDGVGSLPTVVMDILRNEFGIDVTEVYHNDGQPNDYKLFKYHVNGEVFDDWNDAREYIHSLNLNKEDNRAMFKSIIEL
jgi:hypothetical protein